MSTRADGRVGDTLIDFKTMDFAHAEQKTAAHVARYGMGAAQITGTLYHTLVHDELQVVMQDKDAAAVRGDLTDTEWCWAVAFRKLGYGPEYYEDAGPGRRRQLEQHYQDLAPHDTRKGRRAAKVVRVFVEYTLAGRGPLRFQGSVTGRFGGGSGGQSGVGFGSGSGGGHNDQMDVYRYLHQQLPKEKP